MYVMTYQRLRVFFESEHQRSIELEQSTERQLPQRMANHLGQTTHSPATRIQAHIQGTCGVSLQTMTVANDSTQILR